MSKTNKNSQQKKALKALIQEQAKKPVELTYGEGENELVIKVMPVISFTQRSEMVKFIVDSVFTDGIETVQSYTPEYGKLAKRYAVIQYFTDLKVPEKLDDLWLIVNHTSIYQDVVDIVGDDVADIFREADLAINAKRDYLTHKTDFNKLISKIGDTVDSLGKEFSGTDLTALLEIFKGIPNMSETQIIDGILKAKQVSEDIENQ